MGQRVDVNSIGSLLSLISHVHSLLASDQVDQLVAVLADNHGSKKFAFTFHFVATLFLPVVTGDVVPADAVVVFVVEDGKTGLVMELLQPLDGDPDVVLGVDGPVLDSLEVVGLSLSLPTKYRDRDPDIPPCTRRNLLSSGAPEGLPGGGPVGRGDAGVVGAGPEPPVDDDGSEMGRVAALVLEVAFSAACVHRGDVI